MAEFVFEQNADGTIQKILKDGNPQNTEVRLEQVFSVVTIYFESARHNLAQMNGENDSRSRRRLGMQCFLMSLMGLEAFTNTYFLLRGREQKNSSIERRVNENHGSITKKIESLVKMTFGELLEDQKMLIGQIYQLTQLRHEIVHPKWTPASLEIQSENCIILEGLTENRQAIFEEEKICREALFFCLLVIARVGQISNSQNIEGFLFHWTGFFGLTLDAIVQEVDDCAMEH